MNKADEARPALTPIANYRSRVDPSERLLNRAYIPSNRTDIRKTFAAINKLKKEGTR